MAAVPEHDDVPDLGPARSGGTETVDRGEDAHPVAAGGGTRLELAVLQRERRCARIGRVTARPRMPERGAHQAVNRIEAELRRLFDDDDPHLLWNGAQEVGGTPCPDPSPLVGCEAADDVVDLARRAG